METNKNRFLVLALDNASYHRTSEILDLPTEHKDHVFVIWTPKYSPKLNMIEGLWGYLKQSALNNYFLGDLDSLEAAVDDAFKELQQHPETALSLAYRTLKNLCKSACPSRKTLLAGLAFKNIRGRSPPIVRTFPHMTHLFKLIYYTPV